MSRPRRQLKPLAILGGLVAIALSTIVGGGRRAQSPEEIAAAAKAPELSRISATVERRSLESKVITRGSVVAERSSGIDCVPSPTGTGERSGGSVKPVFTRRPPVAGESIREGQIAGEVNGRPVLVLQGEMPVFREIGPQTAGEDVRQLQAALRRLGFYLGADDGVFGRTTQQAVVDWYRSLGYVVSGPTNEHLQMVKNAEQTLEAATTRQDDANAVLDQLRRPADEMELLQAQLTLEQAEARLAEVQAAGEDYRLAGLEVQRAADRLEGLLAPKDTAAAEIAVMDTRRAVADARSVLDEVKLLVGVRIPFCEVFFVPRLPAVVSDQPGEPGSASSGASDSGDPDESQASRDGGQDTTSLTAGGVWLRLTGGTLTLEGRLSKADASLLREGMAAQFGSDEIDGAGRVSKVGQPQGDGSASMAIVPDVPLGADWHGRNVKVIIPVGSTQGDVLVVPIAAVSARPDGSARVLRLVGAAEQEVSVQAGLSADGYVEVQPIGLGRLDVGDKVLVGR